jgi:hypothetical protein
LDNRDDDLEEVIEVAALELGSNDDRSRAWQRWE